MTVYTFKRAKGMLPVCCVIDICSANCFGISSTFLRMKRRSLYFSNHILFVLIVAKQDRCNFTL